MNNNKKYIKNYETYIQSRTYLHFFTLLEIPENFVTGEIHIY